MRRFSITAAVKSHRGNKAGAHQWGNVSRNRARKRKVAVKGSDWNSSMRNKSGDKGSEGVDTAEGMV